MSSRRLVAAGHDGQRWPGMQQSRMDVISWLIAGGVVVDLWAAMSYILAWFVNASSKVFGSCLEVDQDLDPGLIYVGIGTSLRRKILPQ